MTRLIAIALTALLCTAETQAQQTGDCPVPNYMLFGDSSLERVNAAVAKQKAMKIVVVGTASSTLPGRDGAAGAYPARLEAALKRRLPGVAVNVATFTKPRQTASQMAESLEKLLLDEKPNLVVWQAGTFDALQGVDPEQFRASVADGVETLQAGGADVILMNMQYSPRTEFDDRARRVHRQHEMGRARARGAAVRPACDHAALVRHRRDRSLRGHQGHQRGEARA